MPDSSPDWSKRDQGKNAGAHHVFCTLNTRCQTILGRPSIGSLFPGWSQDVKPAPDHSSAPSTRVHVYPDSRIDIPDDGPLNLELRAFVGKQIYTRDSSANQGEKWHAVGSAAPGEPASVRGRLLSGPVVRSVGPQLSENGSIRIDCFRAAAWGINR